MRHAASWWRVASASSVYVSSSTWLAPSFASASRVGADLVEAALTGDALIVGELRLGDAQPDPRAQRRHRPAFLVGDLAEPRQPRVAQPGETHPDRVPRIAETYRASQRGVAGPADPDRRMRRPHRARPRVHVAEGDERAVVGGRITRPRGLDRGQVVVRHRPPSLERHAERREFLLRPADA